MASSPYLGVTHHFIFASHRFPNQTCCVCLRGCFLEAVSADHQTMLLQSVDLAASHFSELDEFQFEKVLAGIAHLNILTPVKVTIDDSVLTSNDPTIVNRLKSVILIHSFSLGCRIYNEAATIKLFDSGVSTVFVDQATITAASQSIEATINLQESLSSLPRNRLGLHLCSNDNLSVIVSKWREYFAHFTIE